MLEVIMGVEFELKFQATASQQDALAAVFSQPWDTISMETTYYDTPDRVLGARKMTLRRRMENGEAVCTVKTPEKDGARGEWDCRCEDIHLAIPELCKLGGPAVLQTVSGTLEVVCGARFQRRCTLIVTKDFTAELALDRGVLLGGGREAPLCEVELELKEGDREAMLLYARILAARFSLVPQLKSKFRRALELTQSR
jgi:inorganic triphosphatase YgiF